MATAVPNISLLPVGRDDLEHLQQILEEGFVRASYGSGEWILRDGIECRIVRILALFKADGSVVAYQYGKMFDGSTNVRGKPYREVYSREQFEAHKRDYKVSFGAVFSLKGFIEKLASGQIS